MTNSLVPNSAGHSRVGLFQALYAMEQSLSVYTYISSFLDISLSSWQLVEYNNDRKSKNSRWLGSRWF